MTDPKEECKRVLDTEAGEGNSNTQEQPPVVAIRICDSFRRVYESGKWTDEEKSDPIPVYKTRLAAGADLYSTITATLLPLESVDIPIGIAMAIPEGYEGEIRGRSGYWFGQRIMGFNGTIDADYREEVKVSLINLGNQAVTIKPGFRVGQILYREVKQMEHVEVEVLPEVDSNRTGGFGSTEGMGDKDD